jgi:hypothetical protein
MYEYDPTDATGGSIEKANLLKNRDAKFPI